MPCRFASSGTVATSRSASRAILALNVASNFLRDLVISVLHRLRQSRTLHTLTFGPISGVHFNDDGGNFHGQKRKNDTHASTSDPDSRLYRKAAGREAKLCYMGHATMENRHGLAVAGMVTHANGTAERRASEVMLKARTKQAGRRITVGEDKAYDTADHVANLRAINVTPHVTQNNSITS